MKRLIGILITAIIIAQFVLIFIPERVNAVTDWYNSAWLYRKSFNVIGTADGTQTNYQLKVYAYFGSGTDTGFVLREPISGNYAADATPVATDTTHICDASLTSTVDSYYVGAKVYNVTRSLWSVVTAYAASTKTLTISPAIAAQTSTDAYYLSEIPPVMYFSSKCQTDFDDIRFARSDGITLLDYWIESYVASTSAIIWVEFNSINQTTLTTPNNIFWVYYGNAAAASASNADNTFIFFDDFSTGTTAKWTEELNGGTISAATNQLVMNAIANKSYYGGTDTSTKVYKALAETKFKIIAKVISFSPVDDYDSVSVGLRQDANNHSEIIRQYVAGQVQRQIQTLAGVGSQISTGGYAVTANYYLSYFYNAGTIVTAYSNDGANYTQSGTNVQVWTTRQVVLETHSGSAVDPPAATFDDIYVMNFTTNEPRWSTFTAEASLGPLPTIQDVKVFTNYLVTGDWLIVIRYINIYAPYYDTYDVRKYFVFQLVDSVGTIKAQTVVPRWGNSVGNIYLDPTVVTSLTYGGTYYVKIYGLVSPNPVVSYLLVAADWIGVDLTVLDSWVISSASVISTHYSGVALTTYIADRGEVLNAQGATIFTNGINGLAKVRPSIFQTYSATGSGSGTPTQAGKAAINAVANLGPDATAFLTRFSNSFLGGLSLDWVVLIIFICLAIFIISVGFSPGHTPAAVLVSFIVVLGGVVFGVNIIYIVVAAIIFAFMLVKQFIMDK